MYDYLEGEIVEKGPMHCVLEIGAERGAIGYHMTVSMPCAESLIIGKRQRVHAHLQVRDIEHRLFGFSSRDERAVFRLLLTVSGVGPGLAIKLLSGCPHQELRRVIQSEDVARLKKVKGVGARTADRIIVDLRDAICAMGVEDIDVKTTTSEAPGVDPRVLEDTLLALMALGYNRSASEKAVRDLRKSKDVTMDESTTADRLVREALRIL